VYGGGRIELLCYHAYMKKLLLVLFLLSFSSNVTIWTLLDFKEPDKHGYLSNLILMKFDCKWYRVKNLKYSVHKKPMGRGPINSSAPKNIEWNYIDAYQINSKIFDRVCD
jgi:hypothetical protein